MVEFTQDTQNCIIRTFEQIAPDCDDEILSSSLSSAEMVIDANRMTMFGGEKGARADAEVSRLVKETSYDSVLQAAASLLC